LTAPPRAPDPISVTLRRHTRRRPWLPALALALAALVPAPGADADEAVTEVTVVMTEYAFTPSDIALTVGERARLVLVNRGKHLHEFATPYLTDLEVTVDADGTVVEALGIGEVEVPPGRRVTLLFTPESAGTFPVVCPSREPVSHYAEGMRGTLTVGEAAP